MTKREKIIRFLAENCIDVLRFPAIIEEKKYQRPGTIVIHGSYLTREEQCRLHRIRYKERPDGMLQFDDTCPVEVHQVRDHFKSQWGLYRIIWIKKEA